MRQQPLYLVDVLELHVNVNLVLSTNEAGIWHPGIRKCCGGRVVLLCSFDVQFQNTVTVVMYESFKHAMHSVNNQHVGRVPIWQLPEFRPADMVRMINYILLCQGLSIPP